MQGCNVKVKVKVLMNQFLLWLKCHLRVHSVMLQSAAGLILN